MKMHHKKERKRQMKKRYMLVCLAALLVVVVLAAAACNGGDETTTTAAPGTTAAPSTDTTAAPSTDTTAAPSTDTTTAGPATGEPILIGLDNVLTGPSAAVGGSASQGVKLQIEYVNANGGINGRPLQLIEYDDKGDVANCVANLNKLIQDDKVFATIGPMAQYMQEPARGIAEQTQTPMIGAGPATLDQLKGTQYQWSVMMAAAPPTQAAAVEQIIADNGWKNILSMADVLSIDQEVLDVLVQDAPSKGFAITKMPDTFGFDQTDFQPIINRIMEESNKMKPDAIILYVNPVALPALYKGLRSVNVTVPILAGPSSAHPAIFSMGPQAVEGLLVLDSGGVVNPQGLPDSWPLKKAQLDFFERYQAKYNASPDFFAALGSDFVTVLTEALKQAGEVDKAKLAQALVNLKDVPTLEGILSFTPEATSEGIQGNMVEWEVKGGQFVLVKTF